MELDPSLGPESIYQPLKRNHACLQCKKRKVKCDGTRPHCAPCLRSHAHACRASARAGARQPVLLCEWAEPESPSGEDGLEDPLAAAGSAVNVNVSAMEARTRVAGSDTSSRGNTPPRPQVQQGNSSSTSALGGAASRKTSSNAHSSHHIDIAGAGGHLNAKKAEREKERRRDEEKELLLARIADLEAKLANMSTPSGAAGGSTNRSGSMDESMEEISTGVTTGDYVHAISGGIPGSTIATGNTAGTAAYNLEAGTSATTRTAGLLGNVDQDFDFSAFFLVPVNWPRNLPSPYLLEHLIDTFFANVPQAPRMIHRASLLARLHHAPSHEDFPHPSLLHAISASAASYTAWVHALPPEQLEARVQEMLHTGTDLESIPDFALAQAEGARRAIHQSSNVCYWGAGRRLMDVLQAQVLMSEVYSQKGFTMLAWTLASVPVRLIQGLELTNRNIPKRYKLGLLPVTHDPVEKEERLATVWQTYITDAYFAVGSYWMPSMDERDYYCKLPGPTSSFKKGLAEPNPQGPNDEDVYRSHPVADPFVLMVKTAILAMRSARWRWQWSQRELLPGDEMSGMQDPDFQKLVKDIYEFQATMPLAIKNIFKLLDDGAHAFDANLLCIHIIPQVTLLMLYEQFADWDTPNCVAIMQMQRAYESIVGIVHLIPSNLDVSIIMNSMMCFAFYVAGRIIADFTFHALERGAFSLAVRHRADLMAIQALLNRYGTKSPMGIFMGNFLESYLATLTKGQTGQAGQKPAVCGPARENERSGTYGGGAGAGAGTGTGNGNGNNSGNGQSNDDGSSNENVQGANARRGGRFVDQPAAMLPTYATSSEMADGFVRFTERTGVVDEPSVYAGAGANGPGGGYANAQGQGTGHGSTSSLSGSASASGYTPESTGGSAFSYSSATGQVQQSQGQGQGQAAGTGTGVGPGPTHQDWSYPFSDPSLDINGANVNAMRRTSVGTNPSPVSTSGMSNGNAQAGGSGSSNSYQQGISSNSNSNGSNSSFTMRTPDNASFDLDLANIAFNTGGSYAPGAAAGGAGHQQGLGWEFGFPTLLAASPGPIGSDGMPIGMMGMGGQGGSTGMTPYLNFDTPAPVSDLDMEGGQDVSGILAVGGGGVANANANGTANANANANANGHSHGALAADHRMMGFGLMSGMMTTEQLEYGLQFDRHQSGAVASYSVGQRPESNGTGNGNGNADTSGSHEHARQASSVSPTSSNPSAIEHGIPRLPTQKFGADTYLKLGADAAKRARVMHDEMRSPRAGVPLEPYSAGPMHSHQQGQTLRQGQGQGQSSSTSTFDGPPPMASMQFATASGGIGAGSDAARQRHRQLHQGRDVLVSDASEAGADAAQRIRRDHPYANARPVGVNGTVHARDRDRDPTDAAALPRGNEPSVSPTDSGNADNKSARSSGSGSGGGSDDPHCKSNSNSAVGGNTMAQQQMNGIHGVVGISAAEMSIDEMLSRFDAENRQAQMRSMMGEWQG